MHLSAQQRVTGGTMKAFLGVCVVGILSATSTSMVWADSVASTAVIYAAGSQSGIAAGAGGSVPNGIAVSGDSSFTFSVTGTIVLNNGTGNNSNDADGFGAAVSQSSNSGAGSISGLTGPNAGYLVGVFVGAGGPTGSAPASLDFTIGGIGTSFTSLSPLLDQVFFIGDGLTGHGTGSVQNFIVPSGAAELYLGISDACGYNGGPSCYADNLGSFTVTANGTSSSPVPEPSSLLLLGTGSLGLLTAVRRRCRAL
jgi:hypothetical protein